jgi:hypothetical protein
MAHFVENGGDAGIKPPFSALLALTGGGKLALFRRDRVTIPFFQVDQFP